MSGRPLFLSSRRVVETIIAGFVIVTVVTLSGCSDPSPNPPSPTKPNDGEATSRSGASLFEPLDGVQFDATQRFIDAFRDYRARSADIFRPVAMCPPATVRIDGRDEVVNSTVAFEGSGSEIHLTEGGKYAYKVIIPDGRLHWLLSSERAALSVIGNLNNGTTALHSISLPPSHVGCQQRSMVTDFGGRYQIFEIAGSKTSVIAKVAVRLIEILRDIHSFGIVHGDVHPLNIITESLIEPAASLKIVDFGRSTPYVDPSKRTHIEFRRQLVDMDLNPFLLSPFELEGSPLSRRDDMYRLSEVLYFLLRVPIPEIHSELQLIRAKRAWKAVGYPVFWEFHTAMTNLEFAERPNYEHWISKFTQLSQ